MLRCLTINATVARPAKNGSRPVQLRLLCLCHPTVSTRQNFAAPFCSVSLPGRAAFQLPVGNQPVRLVLLQPRLHGALMSQLQTWLGSVASSSGLA